MKGVIDSWSQLSQAAKKKIFFMTLEQLKYLNRTTKHKKPNKITILKLDFIKIKSIFN